MCGIAGFNRPLGGNGDDLMGRVMEVMHHRGPDDRNKWQGRDFVFGHVRLSIIDISNGKQPMRSQDGRYTLTFNGEIYNYLELRQQLVSRGIQLRTYSDTEVLLEMYILFGKKMLDHLNGMFAFAIHDAEDGSVFLARDHFGIKPLYYYAQGGLFAFGSEIKALLQHPEIAAESDQTAMHEYLTFQFVLHDRTLFKKIRKLEPASYMLVRNGELIEKEVYWQPDYHINEDQSEEQFADELLVLLESSLSIQTRSDVPIGAYLSGGLDSSIVATLASKNYFGDFKTFTGSFHEGAEYDESRYARLVSQSTGSSHYEVYPGAQDFLDSFEKLVYHMDEPAGGPGLFPQYMVSKMASEHVKVVLGGQGGDEIFGGYTRYAVAYLEQCLKGSIFETQEEGKHVVTLSSIIPNMSQLKAYTPLMRQLFSDGLFGDMDGRYFRLVDRSPKLNRLYDDGLLSARDEERIFHYFSTIFNHPDTPSYFNKMTYFDSKTLLPALLQVEDRVSMAVSIESRVPLLDKRIIELASSMPPTMKFAGGKTKAMLLKAVKNILPKEIIDRKDKMGFPTPFNHWLNGPLREYMLDIFNSQAAKERGIYKPGAIEAQITESGSFSRDLWGALNLEVWHRSFID